jgi:L-glyceraldehyde 3-phosphate reductase
MAIAWVLRHESVTTALVGARSLEQPDDPLAALSGPDFGADELARIDAITAVA